MRLYKGAAAIARRSPNALYDRGLATLSTPTPPSRRAARIIELFSLQSRMAHRIADARERG